LRKVLVHIHTRYPTHTGRTHAVCCDVTCPMEVTICLFSLRCFSDDLERNFIHSSQSRRSNRSTRCLSQGQDWWVFTFSYTRSKVSRFEFNQVPH
jgi:hypothetical protein